MQAAGMPQSVRPAPVATFLAGILALVALRLGVSAVVAIQAASLLAAGCATLLAALVSDGRHR